MAKVILWCEAMTGLVLRPSPVRQDLKLMQPRSGGALFVANSKTRHNRRQTSGFLRCRNEKTRTYTGIAYSRSP